MNENNMDLSRARRQLHFGDYIFIHRASLSNIGPTIAHRLKVALMSGYDKVRGTPGDYRNFKRAMNLFIGDRDAQMIVDKIINRQRHVPEFSFEHHVFHDELVSMFWADETMKCNYDVFGDVVSFDATFRTNKYDFVFVPFTEKCVTFGAALLFDETEESYIWMLEAFLKEDPSLRANGRSLERELWLNAPSTHRGGVGWVRGGGRNPIPEIVANNFELSKGFNQSCPEQTFFGS
ncbi:FAR1-related sequence 5-like protein [Tanacetum coccineum]